MNNQSKRSIGSLVNIIRYPIKGFTGEELVDADLNKNKGLRHDRRWAIRNGSVPDNQKKNGSLVVRLFV